MDLTPHEIALLKKYPRAIYHLRSQLTRGKLMPIFGAGASQSIGLPSWPELIDRIAKTPEVSGDALNIQKSSHTSKTQMLFQHFRRRELAGQRGHQNSFLSSTIADERIINSKWMSIVHRCLYQVTEKTKDVKEHPYLNSFVSVIRKAPLTVNYNFDDSIEELLDLALVPDKESGRGYETVWEPTVQYRYDSSVIYHPNGFLPRQLQRGSSTSIVFLEDSFADQMLDAQRGHYATLLSHLFRFTGLLIGLSLDDATLKHLLRQSLYANPGHIHYYVAYRRDDDSFHPDREAATRDSNFETYNLVTLFLTTDEIASLAKLISMPDRDFVLNAEEAHLPKAYTFYLSGAVGVGKTSALGHFKSLNAFDEWLEPKPALLHKAASSLTDAERQTVDKWIDTQFRRRNSLVRRSEGTINIIDRSPLDPLAFAPEDTVSTRSGTLKVLFQGEHGAGVSPGGVIFLKGNPETLHVRIRERHKDGSSTYIEKLQNRFAGLWSHPTLNRFSVQIVDTIDLPLQAVVKKIARIVHLDEYSACDLANLLSWYATEAPTQGQGPQ